MGFIKNMLVKNYSLSDFETDFTRHFYGGTPSNTGVKVDEQTAMRFNAVYACIRIISEDIGMIPTELRKWRNVSDHSKGSDPAYNHALYEVLMNQPNPEMHSMIFEETMQSHILSSGNGYAHKTINNRGQVTKLTLLDWFNVQPNRLETGELVYLFDDRGKEITFRFDEIFHIPGLGYNGIVGYSPVGMAREAIGLGLAAEEFAARFYSNGANVGGIITMPNKIQDKEALRKELKAKHAGLSKSHEVMILEEGSEYKRIDMPLADAEFLATREFQDRQIAMIYRMPLKMIQDYSKGGTYNNNEQQELDYTKHTIMPWVIRWEQSITTRLLTKRDRMDGYFVRFNMDELLRGDSKTRADVNHIRRQDGIITGNEWRAMDDMNPRSEPEADMLVINGNMREISVVKSVEPVEGQQFKGGGNGE